MSSQSESTRATPPEGSRFATADVGVVSAAHFVHDVFSGFLPPLLPLLIGKLGLSLTLGLTSSIYPALMAARLGRPFLPRGYLLRTFTMRHKEIAYPRPIINKNPAEAGHISNRLLDITCF